MEFRHGENFHLLLDGGSGIAHRGFELARNSRTREFYILVTHTHWDHILGFPVFEPLFDAKNRVTFYASNTSRADFNDLFTGLQRRGNLPVPARAFRANITFKTITPGEPFRLGRKIKVNTFQLNHQGVTLAFRVESGADSVVVITDNAPAIPGNLLGEGMVERSKTLPGGEPEFIAGFERRLAEFIRGSHTLVFDSHFTEKNLKPDWGHSTAERALHVAKLAGVERLILFHHAPEDKDHAVDAKVQGVFSSALEHGIDVTAAREGDTWILRRSA